MISNWFPRGLAEAGVVRILLPIVEEHEARNSREPGTGKIAE
jgi:hypothetical protein